jgi:oxygen-independent coproporphyrinogen-3 oxidase
MMMQRSHWKQTRMISIRKFTGWKKAGINRLSIGIQSFFEEDLQWMNRAHNAAQAMNAVKLAQQEGFHNITIDLIYGTPGLYR